MTMNVSGSEPCVSVCCNQDIVDPPGASCYWNASFYIEDPTFPKIWYPSWQSRIGPKDLLPYNQSTCPSNIVCYSDCSTGYNISTYLFGNNMISINNSIDGGLTCRLRSLHQSGTIDYCFNSYVPDGTKNAISVCKSFLDLIFYWNLTLEQVAGYDTRKFHTYTMLISLPFFVATFFIYTIIPELKNLHGLMLRTYISCCSVFFLSMIIILTGPGQTSCNIVLLALFHFAFLTSYFWVNTISFDIWWTFRSLRKCSDQTSRKKYIMYSVYAWCIPMLIIAIGLIRERDYYMNGTVHGVETRCWLKDRHIAVAYVSIPLTITVACNICLFLLTSINIMSQKKATDECLEGSDSRRYKEETNRFYLHLKLFVLMGLMYIAGILQFVIQVQYPWYVVYIVMLPEYGAGPIIFILFVCNDRTKQLLTKHLGMKDWVVTRWMESVVVRIRTLVRRPQES